MVTHILKRLKDSLKQENGICQCVLTFSKNYMYENAGKSVFIKYTTISEAKK